jgi:type IV pilus assembly protein PilA
LREPAKNPELERSQKDRSEVLIHGQKWKPQLGIHPGRVDDRYSDNRVAGYASPAYQDYTIRAKTAEGLSVAASAKIALEESCQTDASIDIQTQTGYQFQASRYVSSVSFLGNCDIMVIATRTQNTGADVDPRLWVLRPSQLGGDVFFAGAFAESLSWRCFGWPNARHLPTSCRLQNIDS